MLFICGPAPLMIVLICACCSAVRFNLAYKCPGPWCQPCGPMAGGAAVAASSAALAIEMLVAAVKNVPAARSVPANKMRIDFMFIAPMLWKKMYGAILGQRRANLCRRQCRVLLRIVNYRADSSAAAALCESMRYLK